MTNALVVVVACWIAAVFFGTYSIWKEEKTVHRNQRQELASKGMLTVNELRELEGLIGLPQPLRYPPTPPSVAKTRICAYCRGWFGDGARRTSCYSCGAPMENSHVETISVPWLGPR